MKPCARTLLLACGGGLLTALLACGGSPPDDRRSVVLVTLDTTRADALSSLGGRPGTTPHLDALAARSALFTQARSETNVTSPSHVTILSGLRAIDHGVLYNGAKLPDAVATLPEALEAAGYDTAAFVASRHLATDLGWRGFRALPEVESQLTAEEVTDRALAWLRDAKAPFFLWVHYWDPHMQYEPPPEIAERFYRGDRTAGEGEPIASHPYFGAFPRDGAPEWLGETRDPEWPRAMYAAELHYTDRELGRLLEALPSEPGRAPLVVVTADHGESLGEHGIFYGHRGLYDTQLHVPLIVHWPGAPARRIDTPVSSLDVAPTIGDLLDVPLTDARVAGTSLAPLVQGGEQPELADRVYVYQNARNQGVAVRHGDWKLIWGIERDHPLFDGPPELYNVAEDPAEEHDLAGSRPDLVAKLRESIEPWVSLGVVEHGTMPHLDREAVERLRALGYLEDGP